MTPMKEETRLRLAQDQLVPVFGPLRRGRSWHRVQERASKLNAAARRYGVRVSSSLAEGALLLESPGRDALRRFARSLASGSGHVRRALGAAISRALEGSPDDMLSRLHRRQCAAGAGGGGALGAIPRLGALLEVSYVEPPYRLSDSRAVPAAATDALVRRLRAEPPAALFVLGPSGSGKSALLARVFRALGAPALLLPARRVLPRASSLAWELLPGVGREHGEHLEALLQDGRLVLVIDGLDENPGLLNLDEPAAAAFWSAAARNRCLLSCRDAFYRRQVADSALQRLLPRRAELELLDWSPARMRELFARAAERAEERSPYRALSHLARLRDCELRERLAGMKPTAFTAWAYAACFAETPGGRFPANQQELLGYALRLIASWEVGRLRSGPSADVLLGLLETLAWAACARAAAGEPLRFGPEDVDAALESRWPALLERRSALCADLAQLPVLSYDGRSGSWTFERGFGLHLAARHWLSLGLQGPPAALAAAARAPLGQEISELIYQGIDSLSEGERRRFVAAARAAYLIAADEFGRRGSEDWLTAMQGLLQPIGRAGLEEGRAFLREISNGRHHELARISCARALAYAGDHAAVAAFLGALRVRPRLREFTRGFYLYWLGDGRPTRSGPERLRGLRVEGWDKTCAWLLAQLVDPPARPLRAFHLAVFADLLETFGAPDASAERLRAAAESMARERASAPRELRSFYVAFERAARRLSSARARRR